MERYAGEGARQIGLHDSISPETIEGAQIVYGNLLDEGEKVRHHPGKLAQVVLLCNSPEKNRDLKDRKDTDKNFDSAFTSA